MERNLNKNLFQEVQKKLRDNFIKLVNNKSHRRNEIIDFGELTFFKEDPDYLIVKEIMESHKVDKENFNHYKIIDRNLSRAISCFVSAGIGDALGTHTEFIPVQYNREKYLIDGFTNQNFIPSRCNLGEFSDDTSMALCLADSIYFNNYKFDGSDLQIKFINWWGSSYNNCLDPRRESFGLGGNISHSIEDFLKIARLFENLEDNLDKLPQECNYKDSEANGNGSIMRLAPVPIAFSKDLDLFETGKDFAYLQSKVTHTGNEAAESCRLLSHLIMKNIQRENNDITIGNFLKNALKDFTTENYSLNCVKNSEMETEEKFKDNLKSGRYIDKFSKSNLDRNWNWMDQNYRYSPTREKLMPGYIGSYCLDALTMALHISYYCTSPKDALLKASNMGGDSDTLAAIVGQIVGSFYGLDEDILNLYEGVSKFDKFKLAYMAYKLYNQ